MEFNYYEKRALLDYLKEHLLLDDNDTSPPASFLTTIDGYYLLTAFLKLQLAIDKREYE